MPGKGPLPKDPSTRVRRNRGGSQMRVIDVERTAQPELPRRFVKVEDESGDWKDEIGWPDETIAWWDMWAASPLADDFTDSDWAELKLAALAHAAVWEGDLKMLPELRLRTAKFGTTPEDRARLKIQFEAADAAEERTTKRIRRREADVPAQPDSEDPRLKLVQ